jgi:hypothetical protein
VGRYQGFCSDKAETTKDTASMHGKKPKMPEDVKAEVRKATN